MNKIRAVKLKTLFTSFMKIGMFTFGGGYAMIPLIEREIIDKRGWIERSQFLELLTLAQSAPGPLALNAAVFVGYKICRLRGALISLLGIVLPSFGIIILIAMFFTTIRDNNIVESALKGMRPAVVALILAPVIGLTKGMGYIRIIIACVAAFIVWYFMISPIYFIIVGALYGIIQVWYAAKKGIK